MFPDSLRWYYFSSFPFSHKHDWILLRKKRVLKTPKKERDFFFSSSSKWILWMDLSSGWVDVVFCGTTAHSFFDFLHLCSLQPTIRRWRRKKFPRKTAIYFLFREQPAKKWNLNYISVRGKVEVKPFKSESEKFNIFIPFLSFFSARSQTT